VDKEDEMAERDKSEADVSDQERPATSASPDDALEVPDEFGERPEADVVEQAMVVEEDQIQAPTGSREEASDADWIDQSIEVPLDEANEEG
jgi:hypothetical protein